MYTSGILRKCLSSTVCPPSGFKNIRCQYFIYTSRHSKDIECYNFSSYKILYGLISCCYVISHLPFFCPLILADTGVVIIICLLMDFGSRRTRNEWSVLRFAYRIILSRGHVTPSSFLAIYHRVAVLFVSVLRNINYFLNDELLDIINRFFTFSVQNDGQRDRTLSTDSRQHGQRSGNRVPVGCVCGSNIGGTIWPGLETACAGPGGRV